MRRRQRTVLNEALHEVRRPLQALALAGSRPGPAKIERSVALAATALERLDREINGGEVVGGRERFDLTPLLAESVERWRRRAALAGSTLVLPAVERGARVEADRWAVAQALDNLVLNAIEHGGPRVVVSLRRRAGRSLISVKDCGRPLVPVAGAGRKPLGLRDRIRGRARHGHGLRVVRRVAATHGGRFELRCSPGGAEAVLELPEAG